MERRWRRRRGLRRLFGDKKGDGQESNGEAYVAEADDKNGQGHDSVSGKFRKWQLMR